MGRPEQVKADTLEVLEFGGIPSRHIWVFVVEDELPKYQKALGFSVASTWEHGRRIKKAKLVTGVIGLPAQRAFAQRFFPPFRHIVQIAEDVADISVCYDKKIKGMQDLPKMITWVGDFMCNHKAKVWGLSMNRNLSWLVPKASLCVGLINGDFIGMLNRPSLLDKRNKGLTQSFSQVEDLEFSLRAFDRDGQLIRIGHVIANYKINYMDNEGGYGNDRNARVEERRAELGKLKGKYTRRTSVRFTIQKKPAAARQEWELKRDKVIARVDLPHFR